MQQGRIPREEWRRRKSSVYVPGCPCCGTVKRHRWELETKRRSRVRERIRRESDPVVAELWSRPADSNRPLRGYEPSAVP